MSVSYTERMVMTYAPEQARQKAEELGLRLTSAYRSPEENRRVGGHPNSPHMYGRAYDFAGDWNDMDRIAKWCRETGMFVNVLWQSAGHYDHVHVDWKTHIELGDRSDFTDWVQRKLYSLDFYEGRIDSSFGPLTDGSVREFQKFMGLFVDGQVGPKTYNALKLEYPGSQFHYIEGNVMEGNLVKLIQRMVGAKEDGFYGPKTEAAVIQYQEDYGLKVDGWVGPQTWGYIF